MHKIRIQVQERPPTTKTHKVWAKENQRFKLSYDPRNLDKLSMNSRMIIDKEQTLLTKLDLSEKPFGLWYTTVIRAVDTELSVPE